MRWQYRSFRSMRHLSLHLRLTLFFGALLLVGLIGLLLFVNFTAPELPRPRVAVVLSPSTPPATNSMNIIYTPVAARVQPPNMSPNERDSPASRSQISVRQLVLASLLGLILVGILGAIATYWLAGQALHPVRIMSQAAQKVSANNLGMWLPVDGPNDELRTLACAFNAMLDRLEHAFTQQSQFVADAAHELRTPLATLRTSLDVYSAQENIPLEDYETFIKTAQRQLTRLERLAADLLFLAQGGQEQACEEIVLGPLLDELVDQFQNKAQQHRVRLLPATGETGIVVVADSQQLTRIFNNLIENGLSYNRPGGLLEIGIVARDAWAVTTITDTGIGITDADLPHIFDRFYRADRSRSRHQGGAGLGLALVADLLRRNGGKIEVTSRPGLGSAFIVYLPCLAAEDPDAKAR